MLEIFRKLDPKEEAVFRKWARDNWKPHTPPDELWHPIVREEWYKEDQLYSEYVASKMSGELDQ
jgi:hypothetical protein